MRARPVSKDPRRTDWRVRILRGTSGRLWVRPANGIESRWLLTGFGRCGRCGGTMEVRSRDARYRDRDHYYQCASYVRRGVSVCSNRLTLPVELAHEAILDAIEAEVLHPDVVSAAIREALDDLRRPRTMDAAQDAALKAELKALEGQISNLTVTVAKAGPPPSLVEALRVAECRKADLLRLVKPTPAATVDAVKLQALIAEWRGLFRNNMTLARQILAQLLDGERVVFTPQESQGWDFVTPCILDRVPIGVGGSTPLSMVAPTGGVNVTRNGHKFG